MWKTGDLDLQEKYISARDNLFSDDTLNLYSDYIETELTKLSAEVTKKYHGRDDAEVT